MTLTNEMIAKIEALPSLAEALPIRFDNGSRVDGIEIACSCCRIEQPPSAIQVDITTHTHSVAMTAYTLCFDCRLVSTLDMRFRDDGSMLTQLATGWTEGRYAPEQPNSGIISKIMKSLGGR